MGVYDCTTKKVVLGAASAFRRYPQTTAITSTSWGERPFPVDCLLWFTKSWQIQFPLNLFHDPMNMGQQWDVYVSAKVDGPAHPHGNAHAKNGAYIDRLILVKKPSNEP